MLRLFLMVLCVLPALALAAEVYRWTDDAGQVHYGRQPPPGPAKRIDLPTGVTGPDTSQLDDAQRRARQQRLLDAYAYEREQKNLRENRNAQREQERALQCQRLQRHWRRLSHPGPIYLTADNGERRYLDDAQREAEKDKLRPAYVEACGEAPG